MVIVIYLCLASLVVWFFPVRVVPNSQEQRQESVRKTVTASDQTIQRISKETAIAIANKAARRKLRSLSRFRIIPCEQVTAWRIIYDGGGPEYVVDKVSGRIIRIQTIPQGRINKTENNWLAKTSINRDRAIEIAIKDAQLRYGPKGEDVSRFVVFACELARAWRVVFDLRIESNMRPENFPNAAFPKYVIDKKTGQIIYRELN